MRRDQRIVERLERDRRMTRMTSSQHHHFSKLARPRLSNYSVLQAASLSPGCGVLGRRLYLCSHSPDFWTLHLGHTVLLPPLLYQRLPILHTFSQQRPARSLAGATRSDHVLRTKPTRTGIRLFFRHQG